MKTKTKPRNLSRSVFVAATFCSLILSSLASAQLMGTKNIPGDYATLAAAITDLNTQGVGAGGVTLNLLAANPETAPAGGYVIGDTGSLVLTTTSMSSPVIIQGNGNTITASDAQTVGNLNDAIFKLIGADWVTITGFAMQENAANTVTAAGTNNMTEWGVALLYVTATDGAQNNTISNNTITLNRTYQNTFGIYSNSTHTATAVTLSATATGASGGNSGLKIYGNNISNVNQGITVVGPTAAVDNNDPLDIGGAALATGNTLTDYGTTGTFSGYANVSATVNGILVRNTRNYNVSYNTVTSSNGGTTVGTLRGIYVPAFTNAPTGTFANTINRNSVSVRSAVAAGAMNGIQVEATTNSASSTLSIDNNDFNNTTHTVAASGSITLIQNASTALTQSISNNTFTNLTLNTTGSVTLLNNTNAIATATGTKNVNNNSIVTGFSKTGGGGSLTFFTDAGIDVAGVTSNLNNNTFSNITLTGSPGSTGVLGINHSNGSGPFTGPNKTISGNTISGITNGAGSVTGLNENGTNGTTNIFNNTVSGITNANLITALATSTTGTGTVNVYQNNINSLTTSGASAVTGIQVGGGVGSTKNVHHNKICNLENSSATGTMNGVLVTSAGTTTNLYNNLIGDLRMPAVSAVNPLNGINLNTNTVISSVNISYNTVYLNATSTGTNFGSSGLNVLVNATPTTATLNLRNNAIVNLSTPNGTGVTAAYRRSGIALANYGSVSNNNDFFAGTPGAANLIFFDGTNSDQTLAAYKARVASRDSASVTENPTFLSTTCGNANFLHIDTSVATQLESAGANVAGITDDFDGNIRQGNPGYAGSGTAPDIGADEFNGIPMDITPPVITYASLANTASMANRTLATTIADGSGVPTMGAGLPVLYYRKGMAGAYTAAQATYGGGSSYTFTIDYGMLGGVMIGDAIQYYVVAQDSAATPNVGANPSAGAGAFTTNPPAAGTPPTPNSYTIVASASGTFNVGAAQPAPYNTLTAAVADLNSKGLTGPATFVLTDADYSTSETFPIVINPNGDSSPTNTITIKPANAQTVAINGTSATGIIRINGADYVTIEGNNGGMMATDEGDLPTRDLTITNSSTAGVCVWITSFSGSDGANNSTVQDCNLSGGPGVVALAGVLSSGTGVSPFAIDAEFANNNILVQNNNIFRVQNSCDLRGTTFAADTGWVVTGNICGSTVPADKNTLRGIRVGNCQGFLISGNTVNGVVAVGSTKVAGIQTNLVINGGTITQNKVRDIKQLNAAQTVEAVGIDLAGGNNIVVTNNFVSDVNHDMTGGFNNSPNTGVVGIHINLGTGHQVYYNSVNLYGLMPGTPTSPVVSAAFAINAQTNTGCNVRDNIFANNITGGTPPNVRHVAVFLPSPATALMNLTLNNNAYYYGTDVTTQGVGQQGNTPGTFFTTLAQLQAFSMTLSTAGTNDNASIAFNTAVPFISADDLHITCGSAVDNAGVPIAGITTDIDGNMRSATTPDLGADETQAPTALSAVSRKTHGGAGDFDIVLPPSGPVGIECRTGGATLDYQVVITFASPVTLGSAAVTAGTGSVAMATVSGNTITVNLTGVTNAQYITVGLNCVSDGVNSGNMAINMGVLVGDTNANAVVNVGDTNQTKGRSGQTTDGTNFRSDVNTDGTINVGDTNNVKSRSGTALP